MSIEVESVVEGVVTGITTFGAFVELPSGETGLVHISEIADVYVKDINKFLKLKEKVKVKVVSIDTKGKVCLSIKKANPRPNRYSRSPRNKRQTVSFEEKLSRFLKESDEKHQSLRKSTDSKRGGRGSSRRMV